MNDQEARRAATVMVARLVSQVDLQRILEAHPDRREAERVYEMVRTCGMDLFWRPLSEIRVRVAAVIAAPILLPSMAVVWLSWRVSALVRRVRGRS